MACLNSSAIWLLEDCAGATDPANHQAAVNMVTMQGGVFGSVSDSEKFMAALRTLSDAEQPVGAAA